MLSKQLSSFLLTVTVATTLMSANSLNYVSAQTDNSGLILKMFGDLDDDLQSQFYIDVDNDKSTGDSDSDTKGADYLVENDYVLKYVNGDWDENNPIYIDTFKSDDNLKAVVPYSAVDITKSGERKIRVKAAILDKEWEHYKSYPTSDKMRKVPITVTIKEKVKLLTNITVDSNDDGLIFRMFGDIKNYPNTQFYVDSDNSQNTGDTDDETKGSDYLIENDYVLKYVNGEWDEEHPVYIDIDKDSKRAKATVTYSSIGLTHDKKDIKILAAVMDQDWGYYTSYPAQMKSFNVGTDDNDGNGKITREKLDKMIANDEDYSQVDVSEITDMSKLFYEKEVKYDITDWDVSNVTNMGDMFAYTENFNQPIGKWNVSNVTDMSDMFHLAYNFNQPIGKWNVSNVTDMSEMFLSAYKFNQNIGKWDVSNVTDMSRMFSFSYDFNQPIGSWDVSKVTNMHDMFHAAYVFNQPIKEWDVSNVVDMNHMFYWTAYFNQPIESWDVSNVTDMNHMFSLTSKFNQNISNWDVNNVDDYSSFSKDSSLQDSYKPNFQN